MPPPIEQEPGPNANAPSARRRAGTVCLVLGALGLFTAAAGAVLSRSLSHVAMGTEALGNFKARIDSAVARAGSPPFRFAVLGDESVGTRALEDTLSYLERRGDVAFAVQAGDLATDGSVPSFESVVATLRSAAPSFPVLVCPSDSDAAEGESAFHSFAGPREVAFVAASALFVVCDNAREPLSGEKLEFLENALRRHGRDVRRIFVFLNRPPIALPGEDGAEAAALDAAHAEFRRLAQQYRVDRVFSGHAGGFHVLERDGVAYVVAGRDGNASSADANVLEVEVLADKVRVSHVTVAAGASPSEAARRFAYSTLRPLSAAWCGRVAWTSLVLLLVGFALVVRFDGAGGHGPAPRRPKRGAGVHHHHHPHGGGRAESAERFPARNGG